MGKTMLWLQDGTARSSCVAPIPPEQTNTAPQCPLKHILANELDS